MMDGISLTPEIYRVRCQLHALKRAEARGVDLDIGDLDRLERAIESLRCAWVRKGEGRERYWIPVRHGRTRCRVLYDAALCCIVTVLPDRRGW